MVNHVSHLDTLFYALANQTRREMLARLAVRSMTIGELAEPFEMSKPSITKHVKVLERAGLLEREVEGRLHHCRLVADTLHDAFEWLSFYAKFWNSSLDELEAYFTQEEI